MLVSKSGKSSSALHLAPGVPVSGSIKFEGVSPEAGKVAILRIALYGSSLTNPPIIQFRNIPLAK